MRPPRHVRLRPIVAAAALALSFSIAHAADRTWNNPAGGSFSDAGNWTGGLPGPADAAIFNLATPAYTVDFSAPVTNQQIRMLSDSVALNLAGDTYGLTSTSTSSESVRIGESAGQTGQISVSGGTLSSVHTVFAAGASSTGIGTLASNAKWNNSGSMTVGNSGVGALTVFGQMTVNGQGRVGRQITGSGTLIIDGATASLNMPGTGLLIGSFGSGTLIVRNGATMNDQGSFISAAGGAGAAFVTGAGSTWTSVDGLYVGFNPGNAGRLTISDGGKFTQTGISFTTAIAVQINSVGTATITGPGSMMTLANALSVGNEGTGTAIIAAGGKVTSNQAASDTSGYVGEGPNGVGRAIVTGAGSSWTGNGALAVGYVGEGTLLIQDGGTVSSGTGHIGRFASGFGNVVVEDAGSSWTATNGIFVGGAGAAVGGIGSLIFRNGGAVNAGSLLRTFTDGKVDWQNGGTLQTAAVDLSGGTMLMQAGRDKVLRVGTLTINAIAGGNLDIADNAAAVDYTGLSPLSTLRGHIITGRAGGAWTGNGIRSSSAAGSASLAVGYAEASTVFTAFPAMFLGQSVDATSVLVRTTLIGDANLSGTVDIADFSRLAAKFNNQTVWVDGDFNYDAETNITDFSLLAANFNKTLAGELPRTSQVPEPSAGLLGISLLAMLGCGRSVLTFRRFGLPF